MELAKCSTFIIIVFLLFLTETASRMFLIYANRHTVPICYIYTSLIVNPVMQTLELKWQKYNFRTFDFTFTDLILSVALTETSTQRTKLLMRIKSLTMK